MKRILSLFVTGIVGISCSVTFADKTPTSVEKEVLKEMQEMSIMPVDVNQVSKLLTTPDASVQPKGLMLQKYQQQSVVSASDPNVIQKSTSATLPNGIVGDKVYAAYEYFDKEDISWEGTIAADATDETKIWVNDLFFKGKLSSPVKFYGIVDASKKTISFPAGQILAYTSTQSPIVLCGIGDDGMITTGASIVGAYNTDGTISFSDYVGANVGEVSNGWYTMFVDLTITDKSKVKPAANYTAPQGMLYQGWLTSWSHFYSTYAYSPVKVENVFTKTSATYGASFSWKIDKITGLDAQNNDILVSTTSTDPSIVFNGMPAEYRMPQLTESLNGNDSVYVMGAPTDKTYPAYYTLGGDSYSKYETVDGVITQTQISGFTTANPAYDAVYYSIGNADVNGATPYMYGTGISNNGAQESVIARYAKPLSTLYFEGIDIFLGAFAAPAKTPFTCYIVRIEDTGKFFNRLDTIATSVIYTENVTMIKGKLATMSFTKFTAMTDLGLPAEVNYLELDDPFIVELSGFHVPNCELAVMSEQLKGDDSLNKAYFTIGTGSAQKTYQYNAPRAMLLNLRNAAYSYMIPEVDNPAVTIDVLGTSVSRKFYPYYKGVWIENDYEIPEWLHVSVDEEMNTSDNSYSVHVSSEPLPSGVQGRSFDLEVKSWGAKVIMPVVQGVVADGLSKTAETPVKVVVAGDEIELTYHDMQSVTLSDVNGKIYGVYSLSDSGKSLIPAASLPKGVYMLRFSGVKSTVVKFVK